MDNLSFYLLKSLKQI